MATALRLRLGTCVFASMLFLIGLSLYFLLPFQPLWTLDADEEIAGTTHDGAHFFTVVLARVGHDQFGPLRLRDCRTGGEVKSFFDNGTLLQRLTVSNDRRFCAAIVEPDQVRVVDFQERRAWSLVAKDVSADYSLHFAPNGKMLHVRAAHVKLPDRNFLFELPSGNLFAPPDSIRTAYFSEDGHYLVLSKADGMHLWDNETRQEVGDYLDQRDVSFRFSPDGQRLLTSPEPEENEPFRPVLWDLATHRRVAELPVELPPEVGYRYVLAQFSPDGRWLVTWHEHERDGRTLEVWDSGTGKRLARHALNPKCRRSIVMAPDSAGLVVVDWIDFGMRGCEGAFALTMLDMPSGEVRWQRHFEREKPRLTWNGPAGAPGVRLDDVRFTPDGSALSIFVPRHAQWEFLDTRTGQSQRTVHLLDAGSECLFLHNEPISHESQLFLMRASLHPPPPRFVPAWVQRWLPRLPGDGTLTLLLDSADATELARLQLPGRVNSVSLDGQRILTEKHTDGDVGTRIRLQAWSVPPARSWLTIVGVPLAVGAGLLGLRKIWRWRKHSGNSCKQSASVTGVPDSSTP